MENRDLLNSQQSYEDDYGDTKQLSVEDHSPKQKFYGIMTTAESIKNQKELSEYRKKAVDYILSIGQEHLACAYPYYSHLIDKGNRLSWNKYLSTDVLFSDDTFRINIYNHLKNIEAQCKQS